jgi:tetratricopeptide (TPR) repeat protein
MQSCQAALSLAISIGSSERQSQALDRMAWIKARAGDFFEAQADASGSQRAAKISGNLLTEASALHVEAICWQHLGRYSRCISLLDRATHLLDLCGMSGGTVSNGIKTSKAEVHRFKSEYAEARNIHSQILQNTSIDQTHQSALALFNIAQIDVEIGASEQEVGQNISTAGRLFSRINYSTGLAWCDIIGAALEVQRGNWPEARSQFQKSLRLAWGKDPEAVSYCLGGLSTAHQSSFPWTVTFLVYSFKIKQRLELHKALQFLGDIFVAQGDLNTAVSLFTVALDGFTQMDVHRSRAECMLRLGNISKLSGDWPKAIEFWETARPLFELSSQATQVSYIAARLASTREQASSAELTSPSETGDNHIELTA